MMKKRHRLPPEVIIRRQRWIIAILLLANLSVVYFAWLEPTGIASALATRVQSEARNLIKRLPRIELKKPNSSSSAKNTRST